MYPVKPGVFRVGDFFYSLVRSRITMRLCVGLIVALFIANGALAQDGSFIVIYRTQASYSNILRFPAEAREPVKAAIQGVRAELVDWSVFKSEPQRYLAPLVIKNEYPASDLAKELVALLEGNSGLGFAVTWTGGIAVTREDRLHAERGYALFRQNPDEYERTKVSSDRARDPVHPENRLSQLRPKPPQGPWWKCEGDYSGPPRTPDQQRRLEDFGLDRFSPKAPGPDRMDESFSRSDLIKSFGQPLRTRSKKVLRDPQDPYDKALLVITTWEYPGFRIITAADESSPGVLWIDGGEVLDAKVSLGHGVGVGQSIEQWERQFGRPTCRPEQVPPFRRERFAYEWEASYFACTEDKTYPCAGAYEVELHIDGSGRVTRMTWSRGSMH